MSVPPDMLARLKQPQAAGLPGGGQPGPAGSPMAQPGKKDGKQEKGRVQVHIAMNMLEQAIGAFGAESKEGQDILKHLSGLAKAFGENDTSDLVPAELKEMVGAMPQMGGGSPMQAQIQKMMQGGGGGAGGMPPPGGAPKPPMPMPGPM